MKAKRSIDTCPRLHGKAWDKASYIYTYKRDEMPLTDRLVRFQGTSVPGIVEVSFPRRYLRTTSRICSGAPFTVYINTCRKVLLYFRMVTLLPQVFLRTDLKASWFPYTPESHSQKIPIDHKQHVGKETGVLGYMYNVAC